MSESSELVLPTERERARTAVVLGVILGVVLAALAPRRPAVPES